MAGTVLAVHQAVGDVDLPGGERAVQRRQPLADSGLARRPPAPPTRQITTAQSWWRSRQEMRNSGSDMAKSGRRFFGVHEVHGLLQCPGTLGFVKDRDVLNRRPGHVDEAVVAEVVNILDECPNLLSAVLGQTRPRSRSRRTLSRARASWRIATSGPLPDRNTLYSSSVWSMCFVAASSPTSVLPAPGTPVTKQTAFSDRAFVASMIEATVPAVMLEVGRVGISP